jgi:alkanesulfonate monooxygenase
VPEPVSADPDYIAAEAREYEDAGYDASIIPNSATWPDVTVTATWALARTSKLNVVIAHRPGTQAPTAAARAVATMDRLSGGRSGVHLILGHRDTERDGDFVSDREARYRRGGEYLEIFARVLTSPEPFDFDGEFYRVRGAFSGVKPARRPVISFPAESDLAVELGARHADVLAFHGVTVPEAAANVEKAKLVAGDRNPSFWINLNMIVGETDEAARRHVAELEAAIRRLLAFRTPGGLRSIREERFAERDVVEGQWGDDVLYLGLTALSRATPALVGSPSTIADTVLAYYEAGIEIVTLGTHVTNGRDAELRSETLRLIKQAVSLRDAAAQGKGA